MALATAPGHGALLRRMFDAAVAAAQPAICLPPLLPARPAERTIVIRAGEASAAMARALQGQPQILELDPVGRLGDGLGPQSGACEKMARYVQAFAKNQGPGG